MEVALAVGEHGWKQLRHCDCGRTSKFSVLRAPPTIPIGQPYNYCNTYRVTNQGGRLILSNSGTGFCCNGK